MRHERTFSNCFLEIGFWGCVCCFFRFMILLFLLFCFFVFSNSKRAEDDRMFGKFRSALVPHHFKDINLGIQITPIKSINNSIFIEWRCASRSFYGLDLLWWYAGVLARPGARAPLFCFPKEIHILWYKLRALACHWKRCVQSGPYGSNGEQKIIPQATETYGKIQTFWALCQSLILTHTHTRYHRVDTRTIAVGVWWRNAYECQSIQYCWLQHIRN